MIELEPRSWCLLDDHLPLGEQSRKIRLTQVDWGWMWGEVGDTSNWLSRWARSQCSEKMISAQRVCKAGN